MKIAIIGSGVAGLTSAYLLAKDHNVTVYEKDSRIGGHAHTLYIPNGRKKIPVDNGFMVFNPSQYPNFIQLLDLLGVESTETKMTFGVHIRGQVMFRGDFLHGLFAKRSNIFNPRYYRFLLSIVRFRNIAKMTLQKQLKPTQTLGEFLQKYQLNCDLAQWFLYPMLSAIWSIADSDKVAEFPALATFTFLNNHRLLDATRPRWRTIVGGSVQYVSKIESYIKKHGGTILLNHNITNISRTKRSVSIAANGKTKTYDYVLLATHADVTQSLLTDITTAEQKALQNFTYSTNKTMLHHDSSFVPSNKNLLAAWNYTQYNAKNDSKPKAVFTYCMNILQHIPMATPVFVSLNPHVTVDPKKIYSTEQYQHPRYTLRSLEGQKAVQKLQGTNRTLYAGAYLGYGFHEDGVVSAITALKAIGVTPPWTTK